MKSRFAALLFLLCFIQGCSFKDEFKFTERDVNMADLTPLGGDHYMGAAKLGTYMNGHGLTQDAFTFVIVYQSPGGKPELIWPYFDYGHDQANAAKLGDVLVFTAKLKNRHPVLMAHHPGEPLMVITPAVLRLAARRPGGSVLSPGTDYAFSQVRLPPDRVWLEGGRWSVTDGIVGEPFTVELTADDLAKVMDETRRRGTTVHEENFSYIAESGGTSQITASDVASATTAEKPVEIPKTLKGRPYVPERERVNGHGLVDPSNHYAYFSTVHQPGRIVKVALGTDARTQATIIGAAVLEPREDNAFYSAMDLPAGNGYFGAGGTLVKIALGAGAEPPYRINSVPGVQGYNIGPIVIDSGTGYGCFNSFNKLLKIKLGKMNEPATVVSSLDLPVAYSPDLVSAVLDPTTHCAYFGTDLGSDMAKIYKVDLGVDDGPPRLVGELQVSEDEGGLRGALIDPKSGCAWFTSHYGSVLKISLGGKDQPPVRLGAVKMDYRFRYLENTFGMDDEGYGYFGCMSSGNSDAAVIKIALGKDKEPPRYASALVLKPGDSIAGGVVDPNARTLCLGLGYLNCSLVKLALGEGDAPPKIISTAPPGRK